MDWCCIAAVNDNRVLEANLAASPALRSDPARLTVLRDQASASAAYNAGLNQTSARICVFAHQDVYLPLGWDELLARHVAQLDRTDPDWAVAGLFGISVEGAYVGRVWSTGLGKELGAPFRVPVAVQSLDELLIVLNRPSGLRFDPALPSFHLYATDIVQTALAAGKGAYALDAPVVHNSVPTPTLRGGFTLAYDYMRSKWRHRLPIVTPVTQITRLGWKLRWQVLRGLRLDIARSKRIMKNTLSPRPDPKEIAMQMKYE